MEAESEQELIVKGITCGHCAQALTEALAGLEGVRSTDVDPTTGRVGLQADAPISPEIIRTAVTGAGFELMSVRERTR